MWDRKKTLRVVLASLGVLATSAVVAFCVYMLWEQAPEVEKPKTEQLTEKLPESGSTNTAAESAREKAEKGLPFDTKRKDGVYTMLLVGNDDGTGNTDTIMVGKLDTVRHSMNFVSIPRDTIINVDWSVRKLNSVYWGAKNNGENGIDALRRHVKKLVGFDVDCYAVIDLEAFQQVIDALGGVWFDVPQRMQYDDGTGRLHIDLEPGYQLLDGYQSMCLCRYRSSYVDGDIGRIAIQHDFLKAAADQLLSLGSVPNAGEIARIISRNTDTNLTAANIAYFVRQALMCKSEDVNFYTAPHTPAYVQELSYAFLDLYDWLEMINTQINPFSTAVGEGNLDLVYLYNGNVCCTTVLNGPGYYDLGRGQGSAGGGTETPVEPTPEPAPQPPAPTPVQPTPKPYDQLFRPVEDPEPSALPGDDWLSLK